MKRVILLFSVFWLLFSPSAQALIDTDTDGLGDIWEAQHGFLIGANPPVAEAPEEDPDGDGFTNQVESRAGTDPQQGDSFPRHAFALIPPAYEVLPETLDGDSLAVLIDPPVSILTWPTVPGKSYEAIPSEDLIEWPTQTGAFLGSGIPFTFESESLYSDGTAPEALFWRVEINDTDSDEDSLTDYEELHITDPANPSKTLDPFDADTDGDGLTDSEEYIPGSNGHAAFTNYLTTDPDGSHGLLASLTSGLIARWDLEGQGIVPVNQQGPYYTLARYVDSVGTNHIVPFHTETKPEGMPSNAAGTTSAGAGFLCPPRTLLHNRTTYSVSLWAKIESGSISATRPFAALFTHHRRLPKPVPYQSQFTIDINGMWIERLANGTQILRSGTSNFINYTPGTNQQVNGTWTFNGVTSAAKPAGTFDDGKYHHFLAVRTSGTVALYMDGALIGTNNSVVIAAINATNETKTGISLGRYYGEPAEDGIPYTDLQAAKASFDRVRLWSRTLTAAEAESLYKQDIDRDGLWDITEERTRQWDDHNLNAIVESGEFRFIANPLHADPANSDHDTDEITSVHEQNVTLTKIDNPDTDGDGLPDGFEDKYRPTLDPLVVNNGLLDPDGDGLTTAQEYVGRTNPTVSDAHLYPPTWISVERSLQYDFDDYGYAYPTAPKKLSTTASWPGANPTNEDPLTTMSPFAQLSTLIAQRQPFPASFPPNKLSPELEAGGTATTIPNPPCHHASLSQRRIIVKVATPSAEPREFKAILLTERTINGIEQPDEAETLTLTVPPNATQSYPYDLIPSFTGGGFGSSAYSETIKHTVIKYDITEVISDQIAGNKANRLPTLHYGGHPNNPMLMGTRSGQNAKLRVSVLINPKHAPGMFVGARVVGTTQILGSTAFIPAAISTLDLAFKAQDGTKLYEIVVGYDTDKDGRLDPSEAKNVFQKTPKINKNGTPYSGGDPTYALMDKILIATRNDCIRAGHETAEYDFDLEATHDTGSDLMGMFSRGETTVPGVSATVWKQILDANKIPSPQGLSHPLGAKWNAANQSETFKLIFPFNSNLGSKVHESDGFKLLINRSINRLILANKAALLAAATTSVKESNPILFTDDQISFETSDYRSDVHLALGKCDANGTITFKYRKSLSGGLEILEFKCDGFVTDLYDWAYGTSLTIPIYGQIDLTKDAAITQAAFATLTDPRWTYSGRVFFTNVEIKTGWILHGQIYN
jgi:hypothetical protein